MSDATLTIDLEAIRANWKALDAMSAASVETSAVVKADAYGLGAEIVAPALAKEGAKTFFVALASEGVAVRKTLGPDIPIYIFSGYMKGDQEAMASANLIPLLNSPEQVNRFLHDMPDHPCGLQLDSGMNRLGIEPVELATLLLTIPRMNPSLVMSHLACSDEPGHLQNATQLAAFATMTATLPYKKSLAATGGTLLNSSYHYDMTRPGVGLYGGLPFQKARPVVRLDVPVIQTRDVLPGETVGYGGSWTAQKLSKIATISAGYADGLIRQMGFNTPVLFADTIPCPIVGRVSMDLITVDVTHLEEIPDTLSLLGPAQTIDDLATKAGTIGYEILTSLGSRYNRRYIGA